MFHSEREQYAQLERDARRLAETISGIVGHEREAAGDIAREKMEHVKERAHDMYDRARSTAEEKAYELDDLARENVWKTAAISAAIGAVIGTLITRNRR